MTAIAFYSTTLLMMAISIKLFKRWLSTSSLTVLAICLMLISFIQVNQLTISAYVFAVTSYLSISTLLLLTAYVLINYVESLYPSLNLFWQNSRQWLPVYVFFVINGIILYPMASGLTMLDPYRWGFANSPDAIYYLLYLMISMLVCIIYNWYLLFALLLSAVLCFKMKIMVSLNLWDYLMDPFIVFYSAIRLVYILPSLLNVNKRSL
ncbi:hypothetical protein [Spartinivicinus poritis]|uniref:NADH dehydrogenase subunit 6 n=1 Tax=Spartinivicinus poritis TaxID=2994640 RepID=A0ABT5UDJ3_9GAMM|nr:hypothetical protein [Spartinivicinus sp. A2-2]MDE1463543.1 hypothetical protein [Spartinivicinus sp. A2-2]